MNRNNKNNRGVILLNVLVFSAIAVVVVTFFISWASSSIKIAKLTLYKEQAFQIAEAGIDYYRWHLAHSPNDFQDGTGTSGPYSHVFYDKDGNAIGDFILTITPPITGSTIVTIKSEGHVDEYPLITRTIQVRLAIPSFAKFAIVANDFMRFGDGTEVFGPIHSNSGIRFDGLAHNLITSAVTSFNDPDHTGNNEFGVHTHLNTSGAINDSFRILEAPPASVPTRSDVFIAGRQFPVPQADFTGITSDLSLIKTDALADGKYLAPSGSKGYHIVLKTDDTYDLYKVTSLYSPGSSCQSSSSSGDTTWGSWSIKTSGGETFLGNFDNPTNGLIFVEDDVWVDGQIDGARITIASGVFPDNASTRKNIIINKDLLYTNYDGTDVIGLIAQQNITVGMVSEDDLRIDAALMAVNGKAGRYYYSSWSCSPYHARDSLTLYGMIGSSKRYGFAYTDGTGYNIRTIIYDANLLYGPPVSFPLTSDKYVTISWEELE